MLEGGAGDATVCIILGSGVLERGVAGFCGECVPVGVLRLEKVHFLGVSFFDSKACETVSLKERSSTGFDERAGVCDLEVDIDCVCDCMGERDTERSFVGGGGGGVRVLDLETGGVPAGVWVEEWDGVGPVDAEFVPVPDLELASVLVALSVQESMGWAIRMPSVSCDTKIRLLPISFGLFLSSAKSVNVSSSTLADPEWLESNDSTRLL